jgi:hypothetical protein
MGCPSVQTNSSCIVSSLGNATVTATFNPAPPPPAEPSRQRSP